MTDKKSEEIFNALVEVITQLRNPEHGCPWDKEQTHQSLKQFVIEEAYELVDAIDNKPEKINEELGDVLLQVLLHSEIASEQEGFDIYDVIDNLRQKLVRRHPHVFAEEIAKNAEEVLNVWQKVKKTEQGILDGIPLALPALLRAVKIIERAKHSDLKIEVSNPSHITNFIEKYNSNEELDRNTLKYVLFELAIVCNKNKYNPEELLQEACSEFTKDFKNQEEKCQ